MRGGIRGDGTLCTASPKYLLKCRHFLQDGMKSEERKNDNNQEGWKSK